MAAIDKGMKALYYNRYGGLDELKFDSLPVPRPKDNEVLIQNYAVALNPIDWKLLDGSSREAFPKQFPVVMGYDCAGIVTEVGKNVTKFKPGDAIFGNTINAPQNGTFAEFCTAPESMISMKPRITSFMEAAALGLAAETALLALQAAKVTKRSKVLILGGSGSVGSTALQIAKAYGAYVVATCGTRNVELVKNLGADKVLDYKSCRWYEELKNQEFDAIFDSIGESGGFEHASAVLKKGGEYVSCVSSSHKSTSDVNFTFVATPKAANCAERLDEAAQLVEKGLLKPLIDKVYDFEFNQMIDMIKYSKTGKARGKLVVSIKS